MIQIKNILKCKFHPSSSSSLVISPLYTNRPDPWPTLGHCLFSSSSPLYSLCNSNKLLTSSSHDCGKSVIKSTHFSSSQSNAKDTFPDPRYLSIVRPFCRSYCTTRSSDNNNRGAAGNDGDATDQSPWDNSTDEPDGPDYPNFAFQYKQKAEFLQKSIARAQRVDKLFELIYSHIDYVGRINSGAFITRLSSLTDPREKGHGKLNSKQLDFLTKLVLVNVNVLSDVNLVSLISIILSQKLSNDHNLTLTTLQEIRRRLKDFSVRHLVWLWKQCGYKIRLSNESGEWAQIREEIINVIERRVNDFSYDFQNVTEISQLARILLSKSSSVPYLHRLLKNLTIFTESIDYGLAWALLVQLTPPVRKNERMDSKDLGLVFSKCYQVIQDKLFETNFQMDNYIKDYFFARIVESPDTIKINYDPVFFKTLRKLVKKNQKYLGPDGVLKCLYFFGNNRYYPSDLIESLCVYIEKHPDEYLADGNLKPTHLVKILSESRFFEGKPERWAIFSKVLLDPVKISSLEQIEKFRLLSYLLVMEDYDHLNVFCPEFDELCEKTQLLRTFWRAFHNIYAGLWRRSSTLEVEGQLIKESLEKHLRRGRRCQTFLDRPINDGEFERLMVNALGGRSNFVKKVWAEASVLLNYVFVWDKQGNLFKFGNLSKNNVVTINDLVQDLNNYHVIVTFPIEESHYCHEPPIMRGQFKFKLSLIRELGFIPLIIDRRDWEGLDERQKLTILQGEIGKVRSACFDEPSTNSNQSTDH